VVKSLTPDMDAEGLGGSVNMLPMSLPEDGKPILNITGSTGAETLRPTGIFQGSITAGTRFAIPGMRSFANPKPFSVLFSYDADSDRRGIDDVEEDYNSATNGAPASLQDLQLRWYQAHRVRQGIGGAVTFDPDNTTHFYLRALTAGYDEQIQKNRLQLNGLDGSNGALTDNGGGNYTATGATAVKNFTNSNERVGNNLIELGGSSMIDNVLNVDLKGSYTEGYDDVLRNYSTKFKDSTGYTINYSTANPNIRTYSAYDSTNTPVDLSNPALYTLSSVSNTPGRSLDQEFGVAGNGSFATHIFGALGEAKFGAQVGLREEGTWQSPQSFTVTHDSLAQLDGGNGNVTYYNDNYTIGPNVCYSCLYGVITSNGAPAVDLTTWAHNAENVYAGYVEDTTSFGPLEVLAGVRVEATNGTYKAYINGVTPNTNKQDYVNVFPAVQLKYVLNDQWQFRAAYSTGIARPGFQQISAAESIDTSTTPTAVTKGNPNLKPTTGNSFDLTAEYYPAPGSMVSVGTFYKLFDNYIVQTYNPNGTYQGAAAAVTSYSNIGGAYTRGLEFDLQQKFVFLPAPLDGFGTDDNITLVDSHGRYDNDGNGNFFKANQLPETSPVSYNVSVFYEKGPLEARLAGSYVSRNLWSVASGGRANDIFSQPRFRLDVSAAYDVTPRLQLYVEGKNLTNTKLEFTQSASSAYPIQREFYAQDFIIGFHAKLGG
jgi:TonB-dependent receptor